MTWRAISGRPYSGSKLEETLHHSQELLGRDGAGVDGALVGVAVALRLGQALVGVVQAQQRARVRDAPRVEPAR